MSIPFKSNARMSDVFGDNFSLDSFDCTIFDVGYEDQGVMTSPEKALYAVEAINEYDELKDEIEELKQQPTIRDYIRANESDWKKCHRKMVNISSLYEFIGESESDN